MFSYTSPHGCIILFKIHLFHVWYPKQSTHNDMAIYYYQYVMQDWIETQCSYESFFLYHFIGLKLIQFHIPV